MALLKAEEPPTAILYAHAAFLSDFKGARRRAALWYLVAADKLEKTGIVRCDPKDQSGALYSCMRRRATETARNVLFPQSPRPVSRSHPQRVVTVVLGERGPEFLAMGGLLSCPARYRARAR